VPIAGIAGDQQAALFGQACFRPGHAKNTFGTGCFLLLHTGQKSVVSNHKLLTIIAWRLGPDAPLEYALEGRVFIGGTVVQLLRDGLGLIAHSADIEPLAARAPDNGSVYLVPAFAGLGAPHGGASARGASVGLTRGTTAAQLARAALESIAYQSADLLGAMPADAKIKLRELRVDGDATANAALMQFQADLRRVPVVRLRVKETTTPAPPTSPASLSITGKTAPRSPRNGRSPAASAPPPAPPS
jgi:glycerol kinase